MKERAHWGDPDGVDMARHVSIRRGYNAPTSTMALVPGTRLGAYEVTGLLGEGGPPPLAQSARELRRDRAVAHFARTSQ